MKKKLYQAIVVALYVRNKEFMSYSKIAMKQFIKEIIIFHILFMSYSCSFNSDKNETDESLIDDNLIGTWEVCINDETLNRSAKIELFFSASEVIYRNISYAKKLCEDEIYRVIHNRKYEIIEKNQDFNKINYITQSVKIRYAKQTGELSVDTLNSNESYGYNDWEINTEKDITGLAPDSESDRMPQLGEVLYQIYKISENKMMIGDPGTGDSTSEEKRPTEVNEDFILSKNI